MSTIPAIPVKTVEEWQAFWREVDLNPSRPIDTGRLNDLVTRVLQQSGFRPLDEAALRISLRPLLPVQ